VGSDRRKPFQFSLLQFISVTSLCTHLKWPGLPWIWNFPIHIHIHRRLFCVNIAFNFFRKMQLCKNVHPLSPPKNTTPIFHDVDLLGSRDVIGPKWPHIWNSQVHIAYSLCNFYGASTTIKGRLQVKILYRSVYGRTFSPFWGPMFDYGGFFRNFRSPKMHNFGWGCVVWAIARENLLDGKICRCVSKKRIYTGPLHFLT